MIQSQPSDNVGGDNNPEQTPPIPPPRHLKKNLPSLESNMLRLLFNVVKEKSVEVPALHYPKCVKTNRIVYFITGLIIFSLLFFYLESSQRILLFTPFVIFIFVGLFNLYPTDYMYRVKDSNYSMTFHQLRESIRFYNRIFVKELKGRKRVIVLVDPNDVQLVPLAFSLIQSGQEVLVLNPKECGLDTFLNWIPKLDIDVAVVSPTIYCLLQVLNYKKERKWVKMAKKILLFTPSTRTYEIMSRRITTSQWAHIPKITKVDSLGLTPTESDDEMYSFTDDETVAIVNTTGTTGTPKLVHITQAMLKNQVDSFKELLGPYLLKGRQDRIINHNTVMTLCVNCMGLTAVVPPFDLSKPASVNPKDYLAALNTFYPRFGFCSPIVWMEVIEYCSKLNKSVKKEENCISPPLEVLLCGGNTAPYSLHQKLKNFASKDGDFAALFPTYGATECLPICITNSNQLEELYSSSVDVHDITRGYCVGKVCPNVIVQIRNESQVSGGKIGEIWIGGIAVSPRYELDDFSNSNNKQVIDGILFHKTGDIGYKDENNMVWYCGRLSHTFNVKIGPDSLFIAPPCIESVFYTQYPNIRRCACVGYSPITSEKNVVIKLNQKTFRSRYNELVFKEVALVYETFDNKQIKEEKLNEFWKHTILSKASSEYSKVSIRFIHKKSLPVDKRHNSKIEMVGLAIEVNNIK